MKFPDFKADAEEVAKLLAINFQIAIMAHIEFCIKSKEMTNFTDLKKMAIEILTSVGIPTDLIEQYETKTP